MQSNNKDNQVKINVKMPGMRGPRSRQAVEKPKNGKRHSKDYAGILAKKSLCLQDLLWL